MFTDMLQTQMSKSVRYVRPVPGEEARGLTAEVYGQLREDFMLGPVLTLHSPLPEVLAGAWSILRESLMAGRANRTAKEAVAATVSKINECPFCIDAHTTMLHASAEHDVADAILRGDFDSIRDPMLHSQVQWVLDHRTANANGTTPPPFSGEEGALSEEGAFSEEAAFSEEGAEVLGTAVTFHYINRMANVFLGDSFLPVPAPMKGMTRYLFGSLAGKPFVRRLAAGKSLRLVPQAGLPEDLAWAEASPAVAGAFAGFAAVVEKAGSAVLPEPVRRLVSQRIQTWKGESMGLSRKWVEEMLVGLPGEDRPAARLALLTAFASFQVNEKDIADFRAQCPEDAQLVAATAWASLAAARRIGAWMARPQ